MDQTILTLLKCPSTDPSLNGKVSLYVDELASDHLSIDLYFDILNNVKNFNDPIAKLVAIRILEKQLANFPQFQPACVERFFILLNKSANRELQFPQAVINGILGLIAKLLLGFPPEIFIEFLKLSNQLFGQGAVGVESYLRLMTFIDEDIQASYTGKEQDITRINRLKDEMRANYLPSLMDILFQIIEFYTKENGVNLVRMALKTYSVYISWAELGITFTECSLSLLCSLAHLVDYQDYAFTCFTAFLDKGMERPNKHAVIKEILLRLSSAGCLSTPNLEKPGVARLLGRAGFIVVEHALKPGKEADGFSAQNHTIIASLLEYGVVAFGSDCEEVFCAVTLFLCKYVILGKRSPCFLNYVEKIFTLVLKKCPFYSKYSQDEDFQGNNGRKSVKSLLFHLSNHYNSEYGWRFYRFMASQLGELKTRPQYELSSFLLLLKELPEIFSLKNFSDMSFREDFGRMLLDSIKAVSSQCVDSSITVLLLQVLQRYESVLYKGPGTLETVFTFLLSSYGVQSSFENVVEQALETLLKLMRNSPPSDALFERVSESLFPCVNSLLSLDTVSPNRASVGPLVFEILALSLLRTTLVTAGCESPVDTVIERLKQSFELCLRQAIELGRCQKNTKFEEHKLSTFNYILTCITHFSKGMAHREVEISSYLISKAQELSFCFLQAIQTYPNHDFSVTSAFQGLKRLSNINRQDLMSQLLHLVVFYKEQPDTNLVAFVGYLAELFQSSKLVNSLETRRFLLCITDLLCLHWDNVVLNPTIYAQEELLELKRSISSFFKQILIGRSLTLCLDQESLVYFQKMANFFANLSLSATESAIQSDCFRGLVTIISQLASVATTDSEIAQTLNSNFFTNTFVYPCLYAVFNCSKTKPLPFSAKIGKDISIILSVFVRLNLIDLLLGVCAGMHPDAASLPLTTLLSSMSRDPTSIPSKEEGLVTVLSASILNTHSRLSNP